MIQGCVHNRSPRDQPKEIGYYICIIALPKSDWYIDLLIKTKSQSGMIKSNHHSSGLNHNVLPFATEFIKSPCNLQVITGSIPLLKRRSNNSSIIFLILLFSLPNCQYLIIKSRPLLVTCQNLHRSCLYFPNKKINKNNWFSYQDLVGAPLSVSPPSMDPCLSHEPKLKLKHPPTSSPHSNQIIS